MTGGRTGVANRFPAGGAKRAAGGALFGTAGATGAAGSAGALGSTGLDGAAGT